MTNLSPKLKAYRLPGADHYPELRPATADRYWMDVLTERWANRCLPLRIANQHGWEILNHADFEVTWNEKPTLDGVSVSFKNTRISSPSSMFGYGVLTWTIPYLFVTPAKWNLLVRGAANFWKDGMMPLEGMVETDWLPYPFTMSWKITRPFKKIKFEAGDPICLLTPVRRGDVESFTPELQNLKSDPELLAKFKEWHLKRINAGGGSGRDLAVEQAGDYIRGESTGGEVFKEHQTKLAVQDFQELEPPPAITISESEPRQHGTGKRGFWQRLKDR
jgi:hypothetical protein